MAPRAESMARVAAQITALDVRIQELTAMVQRIADHLGTEHRPVQVITDADGMFLPGSGRLGRHVDPPHEGETLGREDGLERIRETREALRTEDTDG